MSKLLLSSVAVAAISIAANGPAQAAAPVYNWTGCYFGANLGGGWAHKDFITGDRGAQGAGIASLNGVAGGGQFGCDVQYGMWVFGAEAMFDWSSMRGSDPFFLGKSYSTHIPWFGTASGRIGYLAQPALLVFFKGGAAFVRDRHKYQETDGRVVSRADVTRTGALIGGGFEWMFAPNWAVTIEYGYISLGSKFVGFRGGGAFDFSEDIGQHVQVVLVGLNYRFSSGGR